MIEVRIDPARRFLSFDTLLGCDAVRETRGTACTGIRDGYTDSVSLIFIYAYLCLTLLPPIDIVDWTTVQVHFMVLHVTARHLQCRCQIKKDHLCG